MYYLLSSDLINILNFPIILVKVLSYLLITNSTLVSISCTYLLINFRLFLVLDFIPP